MSDYDPNEDDDSLEFINEELAKLKSQTPKVTIIDDDEPKKITTVHIVDDDANPPQIPKVSIIKNDNKMLLITIGDLFNYAHTLKDYYTDDEQMKESVYSCMELLNAKYPPNCAILIK